MARFHPTATQDPAPIGVQALAAGQRQPTEILAGAAGVTKVLDLDKSSHLLSAAGASANGFSLALGQEGQEKVLALSAKASTGNVVITPASFANGTTVTFDAVGDCAVLKFMGGKWYHIAGTADTIA